MKKFNINEYMYIQINENGWEHLKKTVGDDYIQHCIESRKVEIENEVWYRLQCHDVFHLFPIKYGEQIMFNPNVMFDEQFKELEKINNEKIIEYLDSSIKMCEEQAEEFEKSEMWVAAKSSMVMKIAYTNVKEFIKNK